MNTSGKSDTDEAVNKLIAMVKMFLTHKAKMKVAYEISNQITGQSPTAG